MSASDGITIDEIVVGDAPSAWREAGFTVGPDGVCRIGTIGFRLVGEERGRGVLSWSLRGVPEGIADLDGIPTTASTREPGIPGEHPNGVISVDHVVLLTPHLERTVDALAGVGLLPRRERDGSLGGAPMRQVFFRLGPDILEVVGSPDAAGDGASSLWGLTHVVEDIDACASLYGDRAGAVKDAVQAGRRIMTLRHGQIGMSVNTALITPHIR